MKHEVTAFSKEFMKGELIATMEDFLEAKSEELGGRIDGKILSAFLEEMENFEEEEGFYGIDEMLGAWERATANQ